MESEETQLNIRRVRSLLKFAAKKGSNGHESAKERAQKETEFFKKLFMECDTTGSGTLSVDEVLRMARKHLKLAERLVSDDQLKEFFIAMDSDGGGEIDFTEFLAFVRTRDKNHKLNELVLKQVKRAVRLAIQRQHLTLSQIEHRFNRSADEGIIDTVNADGSLGPESMRRFFRKVLDVSPHESSDKNLSIAFKAMDEDGGGTLDAEEFMEFIRDAIEEETTLCPPSYQAIPGEPRSPWLLGGMRGSIPGRLPKARPGTTYDFGRSALPFCSLGREVEPRIRLSASMPSLLRKETERIPHAQEVVASQLLPTGLPKQACLTPSTTAKTGFFGRTASDKLFITTTSWGSCASQDPFSPASPTSPLGMTNRSLSGAFGGFSPPRTPAAGLGATTGTLPALSRASLVSRGGDAASQLGSPTAFGATAGAFAASVAGGGAGGGAGGAAGDDEGGGGTAVRGRYAAVKGMLGAKDAAALNRIEQRLFDAGVDVRGHYHKHG